MAEKDAPAAAKQTGATDISVTEGLPVNDTTSRQVLGGLPAVLTLGEAAEVLRIPQATARMLCREGRLPAIKLGQAWRVPKAWLADKIAGGSI
jgi:excisionase family DNA binding protein